MKLNNTISVLIKQPGEDPQIQAIDGTLASLQNIVSDFIEIIPTASGSAVICAENRLGRQQNGTVNGYPIYGTLIFCGLDDHGNITSYQA